MAESRVTDCETVTEIETAATVLKVKRKRTEDPFNVLIVHPNAKRKKRDDTDTTNPNEGQCLFKFAGTVAENEPHTTKDVIKQFNAKEFLHRRNINDIKKKNRKQNKEEKQLARYKVVSQMRQNENCNDGSLNESVQDEEVHRMFQVYELIADDVDVQKQCSKSNKPRDEGDLLCNSVRMIRENLNISDDDNPKKESEYVYDLYFSPHIVIPTIDGVLNVEEFSEDLVLMNEQEYVDDVYDDEDDENEESNWRNDYPDEEDYCSSEDEHGHKDIQVSTDEEDFVYNRYRTGQGRLQFDPYAIYDPDDYFDTIDDDYDES